MEVQMSQRQQRLDARASQIEAALIRLSQAGPSLRAAGSVMPASPPRADDLPSTLRESALASQHDARPSAHSSGDTEPQFNQSASAAKPAPSPAPQTSRWQEELAVQSPSRTSHYPAGVQGGQWQQELQHSKPASTVDKQMAVYSSPLNGLFGSPILTSASVASLPAPPHQSSSSSAVGVLAELDNMIRHLKNS